MYYFADNVVSICILFCAMTTSYYIGKVSEDKQFVEEVYKSLKKTYLIAIITTVIIMIPLIVLIKDNRVYLKLLLASFIYNYILVLTKKRNVENTIKQQNKTK